MISIALTGCTSLFPHGEDRVTSPWSDFDQAMAAYQAITPYQSVRADLTTQGFTPDRSPNVHILNHLEILKRLSPHEAVQRENLPAWLLNCLDKTEACVAYELQLRVTEQQRYGNFLADFLNFRRKVRTTGWAFHAVFVLQDDLVVFKTWSGTPNIEQYSDTTNPLGPLQGIGGDLLRPDIK